MISMIIKKGGLILILIVISACNTNSKNQYDYLPGLNTAEGKEYVSACGLCHAVPHPRRHDMREWSTILVQMKQRMQERGVLSFDEISKNRIMKYLGKHAKK